MNSRRDRPEVVRLRREIAADLAALRHAFRRPVSPIAGDLPAQVAGLLRANPAWAVAAAAGALAGLVVAARSRGRRAGAA
jgi:type VI protein secretion system component VasF